MIMADTKVSGTIHFEGTGGENRLNTLRALCILLPVLEQYGYEFVAIDQMNITAVRAENSPGSIVIES